MFSIKSVQLQQISVYSVNNNMYIYMYCSCKVILILLQPDCTTQDTTHYTIIAVLPYQMWVYLIYFGFLCILVDIQLFKESKPSEFLLIKE